MKNVNNWLRIPGFPPPEKQDVVQFSVLKMLPYSIRILIYLGLIITGFSVQLVMIAPWPGAVFLIFATMLNLVRGYDTRSRIKAFDVDTNWTEVDMDRIHEVENLDDKITKWNQNALDITNSVGIASFMGTLAAIFTIYMLLRYQPGYSPVAAIFLTNAIILILPYWFNGIHSLLKQDNLRVKTNIIVQMEEHFNQIREEGEHFKPALMLARSKEGKSIPTDARFTISFDDMPADFYGVQAQININVVQGKSHPYFYCVIPAKVGFGLKEHADNVRDKTIKVVEFQQSGQAEVIVLRLTTTNNSGYYTSILTSKEIMELALETAREILK